jgi:polyisoprenoid-binding protein YceI
MTTTIATELHNGNWDVVPEPTTATFTARKLGIIRVRGTIAVQEGRLTIVNGEPVAASATLDAASVRTGIKKRDSDLTGRHFFVATEHPQIKVQVHDVRAEATGWRAAATMTVAGGSAPLELRVRREPDPGEGTVRVVASGVLDRSTTPIRAPRWLVGRFVTVEVDTTLRHRVHQVPGPVREGR